MSPRERVLGGVVGLLIFAGCAGDTPASTATTARLGGAVAGLTDEQRASFLLGRGLFERLATPEEGLGPLFNAERCSACHDQPEIGGGGTLRVVKASRFADGRCDLLANVGGDNIQQRATPLLAAQGVDAERVPAEATGTVAVTAPPLFGLGFMELVPDEVLFGLADPEDKNGDGISGRVGTDRLGAVGRFGRKAEIASIRDFVDSALRFELGLTTPGHPVEELVNGTPLPAGVDPMPDPEIDDRGVDLLADYIRYLAPPARASISGPASDTVRLGERLFKSAGCAACHVPVLDTGPNAPGGLREVYPYSDLLLHDMGDEAADVCAGSASPSEYRTPPLWGLRFRTELLHDGSASSVVAALARHGGEATSAVERFSALTSEERASLLRFLETL